jgi:hypothetical protein
LVVATEDEKRAGSRPALALALKSLFGVKAAEPDARTLRRREAPGRAAPDRCWPSLVWIVFASGVELLRQRGDLAAQRVIGDGFAAAVDFPPRAASARRPGPGSKMIWPSA